MTMTINDLTGTQKAAVVLMQIGTERAARVLAALPEAEVEDLTAEIMRMGHIERDLADAVLEEFHSVSINGAGTAGGVGFAQGLLVASLGEEKAAEMLDRIATARAGTPFEFLQHADPRQVQSLLSSEAPQTIALVIAHLRAEHGASILAGLDKDVQAEVGFRIAKMEKAAPDVVQTIADNLARKATTVLTPSDMAAVGGITQIVDVINRADPATERAILEGMDERDKELAEEVRSRMFVFGDIILLEDRAVQLVLRSVEVPMLAKALKGASEQVSTKIKANLSERARENLLEEIDLLGPTRMSEIEEARAAIVSTIRRLEEAGQIVIRREGEDEYV